MSYGQSTVTGVGLVTHRKLAKRMGPKQRIADPHTHHYDDGYINKAYLSKRLRAQKEEILFGSGAQAHSYMWGDLIYTYKNRRYHKDIVGNKYIQETNSSVDNRNFVYSTFNDLLISEWTRKKSDNTFTCIFSNSTELMNSIYVPGIIYNENPIFNDVENFENPSNKKITVKYLYKGRITLSNLANRGMKKDGNPYSNGFEAVGYTEKLIWYFPYFNQDDGNPKTNLIDEKTGKINAYWLTMYFRKCIPSRYRNDERITLLYKIYEPDDYTNNAYEVNLGIATKKLLDFDNEVFLYNQGVDFPITPDKHKIANEWIKWANENNKFYSVNRDIIDVAGALNVLGSARRGNRDSFHEFMNEKLKILRAKARKEELNVKRRIIGVSQSDSKINGDMDVFFNFMNKNA